MAANGRLVIPAAMRAALGLSGRERFAVENKGGSIVLTPVVTVPVDRSFPITPELVASAERAADDHAQTLTRAQMRERLGALARP